MSTKRSARLRPRERLATAAEFGLAFRKGVRIEGRLFALTAVANGRGHPRLGLAAGRRVGTAVQRNRGKRLLRESFRRHPPSRAVDLVLILRPAIVRAGQEEVDIEYRRRLERLMRLLRSTAKPDSPGSDPPD